MPNHETAIAENSRLRAENERLKSRIKEIEDRYGKACKAYHDMKGIAESKDVIIERLERKILMLVNDYVV